MKERHINCALKEDIVVEGDEMYLVFGGFRMDGGKCSSPGH